MDRLKLAMLAGLLESMGWALHFTYSRAWVRDTLGDDYSFIFMLAAAETLPVILSIIGGLHGDVAGRRRIAELSALQAPLFVLVPVLGLHYMPLLVGASAALWAYFWPNLVAPVMEETGRTGSGYARFAIGSTAGWGLGGVLVMVYDWLGMAEPSAVYWTAALMLVAAALVSLDVVSASRPRATVHDVVGFLRRGGLGVLALFLAIVSLQAASEIFWNASAFKLYGEAGSIAMFSLVYSTLPTAIGVLVRPLAGRTVDAAGPWRTYLAVILSYAALYLGVYLSKGPLLLALWVLPVFAFYDTSIYTLAARVFPENLQGSAGGLVVLSYFAAGIVVLGLSTISMGYKEILLVTEALALAAALSLLASRRRLAPP